MIKYTTTLFFVLGLATCHPPALFDESGKFICIMGETVSKFQPTTLLGKVSSVIEEHYPLSDVGGLLKVTSGGQAFITPEGRVRTFQGNLDESQKWFQLYSKNSDTLFGKRPQNIFRMFIDTCLLSTQKGFYIEFGALATDYEPPPGAAYVGGFDVVAQWWSPSNSNSAFLCKEQYGGWCGNVGYHSKVQSNGGFEIARERPANDVDAVLRYTTLKRNPNAMPGTEGNRFPLQRPVRLRMEIVEEGEGLQITSCLDTNADGVWDVTFTTRDEERAVKGYFVPIFRSDWASAEFFEPHIGVLRSGASSCL